MGIIRRVCSVCGRVLGYTDSKGAPSGDSHGYCAQHLAEARAEAGLEPDDLEDHDRGCDCRACRTDRLHRAGDRRMEEARE